MKFTKGENNGTSGTLAPEWGKVPSSVMKTARTFEADGMKAVSIQPQQLQNIQFKGVLNSTPKPTNPYKWTGRW